MADPAQLAKLYEVAEAWNAWRGTESPTRIDPIEADLSGAKLSGADLRGAKLEQAEPYEVQGIVWWRRVFRRK